VMAVEQDMIGLALSNADPNMAAPNARSPIIGNNPFAFAVPAGDEKPLMLDIAMSAAAAGKILAAKALRKPIPENWLVNGEGSPTADYSQWPGVGALLPMAGHKGYGLALLIEVLAGVITGSGVTKGVKSWLLDLPTPSNTGHAFLAIHAGAIMPIDRFKERMDALIREIRQSPLARGADRIYLPGELEWDRRERALRDGITFPADVLESLAGLAGDVGLDFCTIFN